MIIDQSVGRMVAVVSPNWTADWAWGVPLIVLTVVFHVLGLGLIAQRALGFFQPHV